MGWFSKKKIGPSYEDAADELYGFLTKRLNKTERALPYVEKLITPQVLDKIQPVIVNYFLGPGQRLEEANQLDLCRKIKAEFIRRLYLDGYTL